MLATGDAARIGGPAAAIADAARHLAAEATCTMVGEATCTMGEGALCSGDATRMGGATTGPAMTGCGPQEAARQAGALTLGRAYCGTWTTRVGWPYGRVPAAQHDTEGDGDLSATTSPTTNRSKAPSVPQR